MAWLSRELQGHFGHAGGGAHLPVQAESCHQLVRKLSTFLIPFVGAAHSDGLRVPWRGACSMVEKLPAKSCFPAVFAARLRGVSAGSEAAFDGRCRGGGGPW